VGAAYVTKVYTTRG